MSWPTAAFRRSLLRWYDGHGRALPWRQTRDPYAVWVSEIMCQQTRVDTVIPYYEKFMKRFPTLKALAEADEDEVLGAWSGLGYYRRARLLHRGVREVVESYGGRVPRDRQARLKLPGVGRYTAGALGSIAFDAPEPIVDGNVARVLSRIRSIDTPLDESATQKRLWADAESLVRGSKRPGDLNQSVMELGALVCTPKSAKCGDCPVKRWCTGKERAHELPVPKRRTKPKPVDALAVVARVGDEVFLRRSDRALFGGLWNVPMDECVRRGRVNAARVLRENGLAGRIDDEARGELEHVLSHKHLHVRVWRARACRPVGDAKLVKVDPRTIDPDLGVSKLTRKILDLA